jgi:hypothetical protein
VAYKVQLFTPDDDDTTGSNTTTYAYIKVERAPDNAGVAGVWALVKTLSIDTLNEEQTWTDNDGVSGDWYRQYFASLDGLTLSEKTAARKTGTNIIKDRLILEMPRKNDAAMDISDALYDQWLEEVIEDLREARIYRVVPSYEFTPASITDEWIPLPAGMRKAKRIWTYVSGRRLGELTKWYQHGRRVAIPMPNTSLTYVVEGEGDFRSFEDFHENELYSLLKAGMIAAQSRYFLNLRRNWKRPPNASTDTTIEQMRALTADAEAAFERKIARARKSTSGFLRGM